MGTELIIEAVIPHVVGLLAEYIRRKQAAGEEITEAEMLAELRGKVLDLVAEADGFLRSKGVIP